MLLEAFQQNTSLGEIVFHGGAQVEEWSCDKIKFRAQRKMHLPNDERAAHTKEEIFVHLTNLSSQDLRPVVKDSALYLTVREGFVDHWG